MATTDAARVRNVGLFGHGGTGKTMLAEHLLYDAGKTKRLGSVTEKNTVGDYLDEEKDRQQTLALKLMHFDWHNTRVHVVDHPGYADFLGEVAASAPILDGAIIVVDATTGPQVGTDNALRYVTNYAIPHAIFLNKLDRENVDFDAVVAQIREYYGTNHVPLVVPNGTGDGLSEVINIYTCEDEAKVGQYKNELMDVVAESHDELIEAYLENGTLTDEQFAEGLHDGIKAGKVVPIIAGCVEKDLGIRELMNVVTDYFPTPLEHVFQARNGKEEFDPLEPDPEGPFIGQVFRSVVDPYVGHVTLFRVISGKLQSDSEFYNVSSGHKERSGKIQLLCGKEHTTIDEVGPGDIAAMTKLKHTHFGDTIASPGVDVQLPPIQLPESMVKLAIEPKSRADEDKIGEALNHLAEEDPTFSHYRDQSTNEHVIVGLGDLQLDILLNRLQSKYNVEAETRLPKVAYKETIKGTADAQGKHKKQSGGHGQYGDVHVKFSPNERGAGYEFIDSIVGGVVPRQFIPHVDKGIQEALEKGVIAGYPVVDVKAELHFGSYHDVDSSEMAFKIAASLAVQKGIKQANPCLLEPIMELEVLIPEEYLGDITGDLNSKRGRILGMEPASAGRQRIRANVPEAEVLRYATDLRSLTQGRGSYTLTFSHYDEVPDSIAQQLMAEYEKARASGES